MQTSKELLLSFFLCLKKKSPIQVTLLDLKSLQKEAVGINCVWSPIHLRLYNAILSCFTRKRGKCFTWSNWFSANSGGLWWQSNGPWQSSWSMVTGTFPFSFMCFSLHFSNSQVMQEICWSTVLWGHLIAFLSPQITKGALGLPYTRFGTNRALAFYLLCFEFGPAFLPHCSEWEAALFP